MRTNLKLVWNNVVQNLQEIYDLSENILSKLVMHPTLLDYLDQAYAKCYAEIKAKLSVNEPDSSFLHWNRERCGMVLSQYNNGIRKYCNVHKYQHNEITEHEFMFKDHDVLHDEALMNHKVTVYRDHLNRLHQELLELLIETLLREFKETRYAVSELTRVNAYLHEHHNAFKALIPEKDEILVYVPNTLEIHDLPHS